MPECHITVTAEEARRVAVWLSEEADRIDASQSTAYPIGQTTIVVNALYCSETTPLDPDD